MLFKYSTGCSNRNSTGAFIKNTYLIPGVKVCMILMLFFLSLSNLVGQGNDWFEGKPILDIKIKGLNKAEFNEIKPVIKDFIGMAFSRALYYEIENKLWDLDFFDDVIGDIQKGDDEGQSVIIEFTVKEKPIVSDIKIIGNKLINDNEIFDQIEIKGGTFENKIKIYEAEQVIYQYYIDHGFYEVKVSSRTELNEKGDRITVYFEVEEGFKTTIKEFMFSGNEFASDSTLKGKLASKKQEIFSHGYFVESNLELDKKNIIEYYHKHGYIDAVVEKIERSREYDEEKQRSFITITYYITEGVQYTFGGVTFEGNEIFSDETLLSRIKQKTGKVFNKVKWDSDFQTIVTLYADSGYIHNSIVDSEERDELNKVISYHIKIYERDRAHIENIILVGNTKTEDYVIIRELPFEVGDIFSAEKIRQGIYNLLNLQYFADIRPQPVQGSEEGLLDLIITLEESHWADIRFGIAFSGGNFPISGTFGWSDKNFMGTGRTIGVDVEVSTAKQGFAFNFNDSYFFRKGWGGGASISYYHNHIEDALQDIQAPIFTDENVPDPYDTPDEYDDAISEGLDTDRSNTMEYDSHEIQLGVNTSLYTLTLLGKFGVSAQLSTTATYVWYDSDIYRHFNSTVRDNLHNWNLINTLGITVYWDKRDIFYNPESGFLLSEYVGFSGGILQGERDYIKLKTRAEGFLSFFKIPVSENFDFQTVLAFHAGLGFVFPQIPLPWEDSVLNATEREKLYIDGWNIARGWDPVWDGESMLDLSLELRHPLVRNVMWWTWFVDAAVLYTERDAIFDMIVDDFYFSVGCGIRLTMPGLPIRLYLAQRFRRVNGEFVLEDGEIPFFGDLSLRFVISVTPPGGF